MAETKRQAHTCYVVTGRTDRLRDRCPGCDAEEASTTPSRGESNDPCRICDAEGQCDCPRAHYITGSERERDSQYFAVLRERDSLRAEVFRLTTGLQREDFEREIASLRAALAKALERIAELEGESK